MGSWGTGTFENDTAVDWIGDFADGAGDVEMVRTALTTVADASGYIDADHGCEALAACEIVAAALGRAPSAPENPQIADKLPMLTDWAEGATEDVELVAARMPELAGDVELARRAIAGVLDPDRSELYGLWDETGESRDEWLAVVGELRRRLGA